mgnify:CR=1 FL=1
MKNTEETKRSFSFSVEWGKLRERGKARKRRMLRQIELMRLRRIRQQNVPQYTYCKNCGTKLDVLLSVRAVCIGSPAAFLEIF